AAAYGVPAGNVLAGTACPAGAGSPHRGRIEVWPLDPGDFAFKVSLDLALPIDVGLLPPLARRHGLTIGWSVDESTDRDWHFWVSFPGGRTARHWIEFRYSDRSFGCLLRPPRSAGGAD